jgi:hypothetical protein
LGFGVRSRVDLGVALSTLQARIVLGDDSDDAPRGIAVHPTGDELVCATANGCRCVTLFLSAY